MWLWLPSCSSRPVTIWQRLNSYFLGAELPNSALREKTQTLGAAWNVVWVFVTNFTIPYMIDDIHFAVGWVFGSVSVVAVIFTFFFLPETKGRALEEIDAIFAIPFNPFRKTPFISPTQSYVLANSKGTNRWR